MKEKLLRCRRALCVLLAVLLPVLPLSGCGGDSDAAPKPEIEVNPGGSRTEYPYMARTASATWYFAADDIALLGEDAFYEGLYQILENQEQDFADACEDQLSKSNVLTVAQAVPTKSMKPPKS